MRFVDAASAGAVRWLPVTILWCHWALTGAAGQSSLWVETFDGGRLDPARWQVVSSGDFREREVRVVERPEGSGRFRVALGADTMNTADDTVKVLGVRSVSRFELADETRISCEVDWNGQENGSYLTAAVVLAPQVTAADPVSLPDWFKVEYVGVPPGNHARMVIGTRRQGSEWTLSTEGWPERNRSGRPIGRQQLTIVVRNGRAQVWENGSLLYESADVVVPFRTAHLYLRLSSHSNYPRRTVLFGSVQVEERPASAR